MHRLAEVLTPRRLLAALAVALLLCMALTLWEWRLLWFALYLGLLLAAGAAWWGRRTWRRRAGAQLAEAVAPSHDPSAEVAALRTAIQEAVATIKTSKLGLARGAAALYELPWYMIIGHPSAGKSSAIASSGLQFPLPGRQARHGAGGTRHCDWFFTTEGILLDTAGRYAVEERDREEWFRFLGLLRRHRRRAPINGIIIAASVGDLLEGPPQKNLDLARELRTRVQELTERLGVHAPVYVLFTKVDLVAGFGDLFHDSEPAERDRIWGATIRYNRRRTHQDVLGFFDARFDELHQGVQELSLAALGADAQARAGVFTFPLEFAALKPVLRGFLATLFEENTYQFRPVFRGFYFTSALQEGARHCAASDRVAQRFGLKLEQAPEAAPPQLGYFLRDLFRQVIFADRGLVAHYASPARARLKLAGFAACALVTGILLAGWIWSCSNNRELTARVQADLEQAARLQEGRAGLAARLEALELLQARIEQLERYRQDRPLMLAFGLYQGEHLERKLCEEYFGGMRDVLVTPAGAALESALADANAHAAELTPASAGESYNALKAYLMLGDVGHLDPGHLGDQLTRYWRGWLEANRGDMRHEQLVAGAERLLTFFLAHSADPAWPRLEPNLILVDATRENLRRVVRGASARERVFADIVGRASTRYPAVTVAGLVGEGGPLVGSRAVAGAFTKQAWDGYVEGAIREAASKTLRTTDWVLRTSTNDDLSLEGSPDQIRAALTDMYKAAYVREWSAFLQGVGVAPMASLDAAVRALDRLADSQASPLALVLKTAHAQTAWDGPDGGNAALARTRRGLWQWFREAVLRRAPSPLQPELGDVPVPGQAGGRIAREFSVLGALFAQREKDPAPLLGYLDLLARLRARLQQLKNNGDPGPGARQLMQQTLDGSGSELSEALKLVDERMLAGGTEGQKQALRPLLVRPLQQTFGAIVQPVEAEINKVWMAQVVEPFRRSLAAKYPFDPAAGAEAGNAEIGQVFGPDGAVARFVGTTLGPLVVRRGDVLAPRQWGDVGIAFAPEVLSAFPSWLAPLSANGVTAGTAQTVFQLLPAVAPGVQEYTIEVDGQQLRYRNTAPAWASMVHPGSGIPGARISAVTMEGRAVELFNEPGDFGLKRMIDAAARRKKDNGVFELRWSAGSVTVAVDLRVASSPDSAGDAGRRGFVGMKLPDVVALRPPGPATLAAAGGAQ